ncbi:hypothetical protein QMZ92_16430 [Streptomyces sp. HNM0645]|uniref:hypothetical protein n=1 Tax=Streptomyces sp. HNM0645 TaxID=2782343 RepID=UPI0024B66D27|nr:hypothetical protein [Streptomyces sp. HNM0645]MDI9885922.1 hypothetical protein [Streptomyces sp. HNM0645]
MRLTITYWPVWNRRPALALHHKPNPRCPDCDGCGYVAEDPDCIDERACHCAPETPILRLPLPSIVNRDYRQLLIRRIRSAP